LVVIFRNLSNAYLANLSVKQLHAELCRVRHAGSHMAWSTLHKGTPSRISWRGVYVRRAFGLFLQIVMSGVYL
jgi:hypothetical protein